MKYLTIIGLVLGIVIGGIVYTIWGISGMCIFGAVLLLVALPSILNLYKSLGKYKEMFCRFALGNFSVSLILMALPSYILYFNDLSLRHLFDSFELSMGGVFLFLAIFWKKLHLSNTEAKL